MQTIYGNNCSLEYFPYSIQCILRESNLQPEIQYLKNYQYDTTESYFCNIQDYLRILVIIIILPYLLYLGSSKRSRASCSHIQIWAAVI